MSARQRGGGRRGPAGRRQRHRWRRWHARHV